MRYILYLSTLQDYIVVLVPSSQNRKILSKQASDEIFFCCPNRDGQYGEIGRWTLVWIELVQLSVGQFGRNDKVFRMAQHLLYFCWQAGSLLKSFPFKTFSTVITLSMITLLRDICQNTPGQKRALHVVHPKPTFLLRLASTTPPPTPRPLKNWSHFGSTNTNRKHCPLKNSH